MLNGSFVVIDSYTYKTYSKHINYKNKSQLREYLKYKYRYIVDALVIKTFANKLKTFF